MTDSLDLKGFDELLAALRSAPERAKPIAERAMQKALLYLTGILQEYPPQPDRERAKTFNTYVRGIGRLPISAFKSTAKSRGGKVKRISERLGTKWTQETNLDGAGVEGIIGNSASYADVVQGDKQPDFHAETGWPVLGETLEREEPAVMGFFEEATDELMRVISRE